MIEFDHELAIRTLRSRSNVVSMARRTLGIGFGLITAYTIGCSVYNQLRETSLESELVETVDSLTTEGHTLLDSLRVARPQHIHRSPASQTSDCGQWVEADRGMYFTRRNLCVMEVSLFAGTLYDMSEALFHDRNRWLWDRDFPENEDVNPDSMVYPEQFTFHLR